MERGRIIEAHRTNFIVLVGIREYVATVRGVFHADKDFPKVGDYVTVDILDNDKALIREVLGRTGVIKRKSANSDDEQIIVTNVDLAFVVMGLDEDCNLNRLARYLLLIERSGVPAVLILNKADKVTDSSVYVSQVRDQYKELPVLVVSALHGNGIDQISKYITSTTTAVLLGSSGSGKSTITNWLLSEERQVVRGTREDDGRGRHTTTSRQLFSLPKGGYLIDTPGMRELGTLDGDMLQEQIVFEKINRYASQCKFRNCDHNKSAGCAVIEALEKNIISNKELENYQKILQEKLLIEDKNIDNKTKYFVQNQKRQKQQQSVMERQRRLRGL